MQNSLYLYNHISSTKVLGANNRFAIWVQGCDKRCENCIVPDSWSKHSGGYYMSIDELADIVLKSKDIQGLTISGGEPFLQSEQLKNLIGLLNAKRDDLDYIVYTGLNYDDLIQNEQHSELMDCIDLLIDGEYIDELNHDTPLIGSSNQGVYMLSQSGKKLAVHLQQASSREIEYIVKNQDELFMVGIPPKDFQTKLKEQL